jgi:hypothetical protein
MSNTSLRVLLCIFAVAVALLLVGIIAQVTQPECPVHSEAMFTRSGWYCVVPAVKP